jgi:SAM-dependent methyltransferase
MAQEPFNNPVSHNPGHPTGDDADAVETLAGLIAGYQVSQVIYVAAELKLADLLEARSKTTHELADLTGVNPEALYRVMRVLDAVNIFEEIAPQRFALTPLGQLLRTGVPGSLRSTALFNGSPRIWQTWHELLYSVRTGESATRHVFGQTPWEYYAQHPQEAQIFYAFSSESSNMLAPVLTNHYDFSGAKSVADVGGGFGYLLANILKANTHLKGVLFDLPHVTGGARRALEAAGIAGRCEVISGDIFAPWPFQADIYLISRIIHDWLDEESIAILKNCQQAMGPGGKVLVIERIIPHDKAEALPILLSDLHMMISAGGQERTLAEYRDLFQAAGLNLTRTIPLYPPWNAIEGIRS